MCSIEQLSGGWVGGGMGPRDEAAYTMHIIMHSCNKYCRSELQVIHDKLEKEGTSKNDIIQELEALRKKHQNEILAQDHARKLSK